MLLSGRGPLLRATAPWERPPQEAAVELSGARRLGWLPRRPRAVLRGDPCRGVGVRGRCRRVRGDGGSCLWVEPGHVPSFII